MNNSVGIEGLNCPNCAKALEGELAKIDGIKNLKIDFIHSKITFESENFQDSVNKIIEITKKVEPNATIIVEHNKKKFNKNLIIDIITLIIGAGIGCCALFVPLPIWAFWVLFVLSALILGYKTYYKAIILLFKGIINENLLLTISVVGASSIGQNMEGLMVIFLYSIGKIFEGLAIDKSRKSIENLTNLQPEYATIIVDGKEEKVKPEQVTLGSIIVVKPGERVALDGIVIEGKASLNTQSLTGESRPTIIQKGDKILSGTIVLDSVLYIKTTSVYENSTISKIMNLIENATEKKSKTETLISKITRWYTLGVIIIAFVVFGIVWLVENNFNTALYRGLIFLVVSCPCAFAISVPLSYFSGLGNASRQGILIKGSNYLDACAKIDTVAFDKTGTLTTGIFSVNKIISFDKNKTEEDIIYLASLGEQHSLHPLAKSILALNKQKLKKVQNVKEIPGEGIQFEFQEKKYFVGRRNNNVKNTMVELFENDIKIGEIILNDTIKENSFEACNSLKNMNIETIMLSGDSKEIANNVGTQVGVQKIMAELLPQDKYQFIENYKEKNPKKIIGYVGDGLNDAPSLMLADVGISMGINGSPASIEASDIVLVDDNPNKVAQAVKISKKTRKIVWENIIISAGIKITFLLLGTLGITGMSLAVFADVGVTLLAVLNSMRALYYNPQKSK